jgi:hypothetical protein
MARHALRSRARCIRYAIREGELQASRLLCILLLDSFPSNSQRNDKSGGAARPPRNHIQVVVVRRIKDGNIPRFLGGTTADLRSIHQTDGAARAFAAFPRWLRRVPSGPVNAMVGKTGSGQNKGARPDQPLAALLKVSRDAHSLDQIARSTIAGVIHPCSHPRNLAG